MAETPTPTQVAPPTVYISHWLPNWIDLDLPIETRQVAHHSKSGGQTESIGLRAFIGAKTKCVKYEMTCFVATHTAHPVCDSIYDHATLMRRAPHLFCLPVKTVLQCTIRQVTRVNEQILIEFAHTRPDWSLTIMLPRIIYPWSPETAVKAGIRAIKSEIDKVVAQLSDSDEDDE